MKIRVVGRRVAALAAAAVAVIGASIVGSAAAAASSSTLYVGPHGSSSASGSSCRAPKYSSINAAVKAAPRGGTVIVCPGVYAEDVLVKKRLHLVGRHAVIDATGLENAIQIVRSRVTVRGFVVQDANGEGILVGIDSAQDAKLLPKSIVISHVVISDVVAAVNDKGFNGTENGNCKYPGDCGGGIHLNVTSDSVVRNSQVLGNADGILLTDDYGPSFGNVVDENSVTDNKTECGIVLAGHNPKAVSYDHNTFKVTGRHPHKGGLYDNMVINNISLRNGTAKAPPQFGGGGSGSGIGLFGSGPGTGVYNNIVRNNVSVGNGLAGFTIHAHLPGGEDLNGNQVVDNRFGTNNLGGDGYDGPPGPTDFQTTGIAVYSAPAVHMTIRDNSVRRNAIGIWLSKTVKAHGLSTNHYHHVGKHVVRG
jgi:nitrous oxidase accessory protein NosD